MKFDIFPLPTVPATWEERETLRPLGRNTERLQEMYDQLDWICGLSEEGGIDCFSTTEHHFHSEGMEVSVSPLILYSNLAGKYQRIHFAPLALVLPTWDPIRLAEEIAVLDHLSRGRIKVGIARGYQPRWTQVLGQKYNVKGATMDGSAIDLQNREVYDEVLDIMLKAWTEDSFRHDGKYYQVPNPLEGIEWKVSELTRKYGSPGELDANGMIQRITVVPSPYQRPHPPLWSIYAASESTIIRCAEKNMVPFMFVSKPDQFVDWCENYQRVAADQGHTLGIGERVGAVRSVTFGDTYEEAFELGVETTGIAFKHYFAPFGFTEGFRQPGDNPARPLDLGGEREIYQRMVEHGFAMCGTVDEIKHQMDALANCHGDGNLEWFSWNFFFQGLSPRGEQERQLELFCNHIVPEFSDGKTVAATAGDGA
jgi:alkanesulfonate monooxygenase SsuD/methylene tetrahydromethanopterin reductase-like flavin-dependent oxidoreductase (luciferase family)